MASPASCPVTREDLEMLRNLFARNAKNPLESWADKDSLEVESASLMACLAAPPGSLAPERALKLLAEDPELAECFALDAGTAEGCTVGEHTERVLAAFEKHFASAYSGTPPW